jgi:SAM-dependent methyltransferase
MRYVADVPYTRRFFKELTPAWLDFTALICGFAPPQSSAAIQWCELGCGQGASAALLAATHPDAHVTAIDMMAEQVAYGERLCRDAGIGNATFLALDFAAACERDMPRFDYIVAHGVYTWVDEAAKADLRRFIQRRLKPGGLVYLSYNALPGWTADAPLQHLLAAFAERAEGDGIARFAEADRRVAALAEAGASGLRDGRVGRDWDRLRDTLPAAYFPHEFLVPWRPIYVTEMRRDMASLGLTPIGSATIRENVDSYVLSAAARAALADFRDPDLRELVRDYFLAKQFRRDVFGLHRRRLSEDETRRRLIESHYMLSKAPTSEDDYTMITDAGTVDFDHPLTRRILAGLSAGPAPLASFLDETAGSGDLVAAVLALAAADRVRPVESNPVSTERINAAILSRAGGPEALSFLALPSGTALELTGEHMQQWRDRNAIPSELLGWTGLPLPRN